MVQLLVRILVSALLILLLIYCGFIALRIVWTKELDWKYPLKFVNTFIENRIPTVTSGVSVSPNKISLSAKKWLGVSTFGVNNATSQTIYDVYIKLEIEDAGIDPLDLEVLPENDSDFMTLTAGNVKASFDIVQFKGIDSKGKGCIFLILYKISPQANQSFKVGLKKESMGSVDRARILVKLVKVSETPASIVHDGNKAAIAVNFPESLQVKATPFFLRKIK
jgi:hypothetical protein